MRVWGLCCVPARLCTFIHPQTRPPARLPLRSGFEQQHAECLRDNKAIVVEINDARELLLAPVKSVKGQYIFMRPQPSTCSPRLYPTPACTRQPAATATQMPTTIPLSTCNLPPRNNGPPCDDLQRTAARALCSGATSCLPSCPAW